MTKATESKRVRRMMADRLREWGAVYRYEEEHRLSGGGTSQTYIDIRSVLTTGRRMADMGFWLQELVRRNFRKDFDVVHGTSMGGIAPAQLIVRNYYMNLALDREFSWSRPEVKPHTPTRPHCQTSGGVDRIFGADVDGKRVLLVDDVLTTGRTLMEERVQVEGNGGKVVGAVVVVDRLGGQVFDDIDVYSLLKFEDLA